MATQNAISLKASGLASYDGAGTFAGRTIQQPAAGITVADGDGVSGDPTLALADDLAAVEGLSGSGVITRTGASAWTANSIADRSVVVGDAGNTVQGIGPLADGELVIGATGADPAAAAITGGTGLTVTNGTNSITIDLDTPVSVANGGTGATTLTDHGILLGSGTGAVTALAEATNGQIPIGATGADPTLATITAGSNITVTNGSGSITIAADTLVYSVTALDNTDSPYTVLTTDEYMSCDVSAGVLTIDLPNAPATGSVYVIKDSGGDAAANNITVTTVGGVVTIDGATTFVMNTAYEAANFLFNGTSYEVF